MNTNDSGALHDIVILKEKHTSIHLKFLNNLPNTFH